MSHSSTEPDQQLQAECPSCNQSSIFLLIGIQRWSPKVAQRLNVPEEMPIYECQNCHTTISYWTLIHPPDTP